MFVCRRFSAQLSVFLWHQQHYRSVHPFRPIVDLDGRFPTVQRSNRRKPSASDMDKYSPPSAPIVRNPNERSLQVAVIGAPNAGKSELTNRLVGANVSAVSTKIDTTRSTTIGILTRNDMQLVVLDNPGLVSRAHAKSVMHIDPDCRFVTDPETAVSRSDLVIVVFDATSTGDYIHHRMLHMLHRHRHVPSILVVNKIDLVRRRSDLLELIRIITGGQVGGNAIKAVRNSVGKLGALCRGRNELKLHEKSRSTPAADNNRDARYQQMIETPTHQINWTSTRKLFETEPGWPHFDAVFYVSALTNEGVDSLRTFLIERGEQRQWHYDRSVVTTKSPQDICVDCLRGQLLDHLPHDVPYKLRIAVTTWEVDEGVLKIVIDVHCDVRRWAKMVIGNHGSTLVAIANNVNQEMRNLFKRELFIRILVKHNNEIIYREKTKKAIAIDTTAARSAPFQSS